MQIFGVSEPLLRLAAFMAVFVVMAGLEVLRPRRTDHQHRLRRWTTNVAMVTLSNLLVRAIGAGLVPLLAVTAAIAADSWGVGLLALIALPDWLEVVIALVVLDFAVWLQHLLSHKVPLLWRLHQVHHADPTMDLTTGIRFHPIEIALSMIYKVVWVLALGPGALAVIVFEVLLNVGSMFNHANVALPGWLDRILRRLIVTPDMHRVHHSVLRDEHDMNYGFILSIWDHLFATYKAQPRDGHRRMMIGLENFQSEQPTRLLSALMIPFDGSDGSR